MARNKHNCPVKAKAVTGGRGNVVDQQGRPTAIQAETQQQNQTVEQAEYSTQATSGDQYVNTIEPSNKSFLNKRGYLEARRELALKEKALKNKDGYIPTAQAIEDELLNRFNKARLASPEKMESDYNIGKDDWMKMGKRAAGDIASAMIPKVRNHDVQTAISGELGQQVLENSEHFEVKGDYIYLKDTGIDTLDDATYFAEKKSIHLPRAGYPPTQGVEFTTKSIYEKEIYDGETFVERLPEPEVEPYSDVDISASWGAQQRYQQAFGIEQAESAMLEEVKSRKLDSDKKKAVLQALQQDQEVEFSTKALMKQLQQNEAIAIEHLRDVYTAMSKLPTFSMKLFHDWRMRYYYKTRFFNPQGTDFEQASILFAGGDSKPMTAEGQYWFKVHIANMAGKDKGDYAQYDQRVTWFNDNIKNADDYHKVSDYPIRGKAALQEYFNGSQKNVPVSVDSTSSGYQIIALIMGDVDHIGTYTNIGNDPHLKGDMYQVAADIVQDNLSIQDPLVNRKLFKKPAMQFIYGSSDQSILNLVERDYIISIVDQNIKDGMTLDQAVSSITDAQRKRAKDVAQEFLSVMSDTKKSNPFAAAVLFRQLIQEAVTLNKTGYIEWTFNNGQQINFDAGDAYAYQDVSKSVKEGKLLESNQSSTTEKGTYSYSSRALTPTSGDHVARAVSANFVQSIDAYLMNFVTARMYEQGKPFMGTHDSFASMGEDVPMVQQLYLEGMAKLVEPGNDGYSFLTRNLINMSGKSTAFKTKIDKLYDEGWFEFDVPKLMQSKYHLS